MPAQPHEQITAIPADDRTLVFVGRDRERTVLARALAAADGGAGRMVLLVGVPGIGKTRLAEEFAAAARADGVEVLAGRCFEYGGAPAFWPWREILRGFVASRPPATVAAELGVGAADIALVVPEVRQALPELVGAAQIPEEQARFRFFDAVTQMLLRLAATRTLVLLIDDLHGADRSSLLLLQFLARSVRSARVLVIATLRPIGLAAGHPLIETLGELVRERVSDELELRGLEIDAVAELMARMAGAPAPPALAAEVHARTEGNPLYVTEVVRMLLAQGGYASAAGGVPIPSTVRVAITRHLDALDPAARDTLTLAALFGREFRSDAVARAGGVTVATVLAHVDAAVAARIVSPWAGEPGRYRFAHALFGETLVDALGELRRVALHASAARALMAAVNVDDAVSEIAEHWVGAGPAGEPAAAVAWARRAAERAADVLAYEDAAKWYRRALTALGWCEADDPETRAELWLGLGDAEKHAGAVAEARAAFERAAAIGRERAAPEILTRAALGHAPSVSYGDQPSPDPTAIALLDEAVAAWRGRDANLHARALARLAVALLFGDPARRAACAAEAVAMARRLGDPAALRFCLAMWFGAYLDRHEVETRLALATELVRLADPVRDLGSLLIGRLWRYVHLIESGDVVGADAELAAFERSVEEAQGLVWRWYVHVLHGLRHVLAGRFAEAEVAAETARTLSTAAMPFASQVNFIAQMLVVRHLQGAPAYVAEYRSFFEHHPDPSTLTPCVWTAVESDRADDARPLIARLAVDGFAAVRGSVHWLVGAVFLAEGCAAIGDPDQVAELYALLSAKTTSFAVWAETVPLGPVAYFLGVLALALGRLDDAAGHLHEAVALCRRMGALPFLARSLLQYGVTLRRRGADDDHGNSATALGEARTIATTIGMSALVRRVDELAPPAASEAVVSPAATVFRREGDFWLIAYGGTTVQLRDARGLRYLSTLLHHPDREFHATDLAGGDAGTPVVDAHAAPDDGLRIQRTIESAASTGAIDRQAQAAYRTRLTALAEEQAEAERWNDLARAEGARDEIAALRTELVAAARSGRGRTHGERARLTVTKGIGAAIDRIASVHSTLGAHLRSTIRRGYYCVYVPDPRHPIAWE